MEALLLVSSLLAVLAVMKLRWTDGGRERPFKVPLYPLPPLLFAGATVYMLIFMLRQRPDELLWGAVTLGLGGLVYGGIQHRRH